MRKAAILITSLDRDSAESLLAQMPKETAKRVLAVAKQLGKVDPAEQKEVMQDFLSRKSGRKAEHLPTAISSEVDLSLSSAVEQIHSAPFEPTLSFEGALSKTTWFSFISKDCIEPLASVLGTEQPQLVALILAHLPGELSAKVLSRVDAATRLEIVQRIAEIEETTPEVLHEIENELRTRLMRARLHVQGSAQGLAALSGILQASDPELRNQISTAMGQRRFEKTPIMLPDRSPVSEDEPVGDQELPKRNPTEEVLVENRAPNETLAFSGLAGLDDVSLAVVFGAVSPQVAILALVGAEETLVRRILRVLPRKEAAIFRKRLDEVGPLRLKEVEVAQSRLSQAASELLQQRRISLPIPQRIRLAA
jgi:flagellar motor switch protein FliG